MDASYVSSGVSDLKMISHRAIINTLFRDPNAVRLHLNLLYCQSLTLTYLVFSTTHKYIQRESSALGYQHLAQSM